MYNFRVCSYSKEHDQHVTYNFQAKSYRRKTGQEKDILEIMQIQDTIDKDQCSTMEIDFNSDRDKQTSVFVMNEAGKTIDSLSSHSV